MSPVILGKLGYKPGTTMDTMPPLRRGANGAWQMAYQVKSVTITASVHDDIDASPLEYLFQDADYRAEDQARLDAYGRGEWAFVGVQAVVRIEFCLDSCPAGSAGSGLVRSGGLWAIESDSGDDYLASVYAEEVDDVKDRLASLGVPENKITVEPFRN